MAKGKESVLPRLQSLVSSLEQYRASPIVVHCQKGGLRSRSLTTFLAHSGFNVVQLDGGYRDYRARMREDSQDADLLDAVVLGGHTGVGKTALLHLIEARLPGSTLDLEGAAQNRASIFGGYGLESRSQQSFESALHQRILQLRWRGEPRPARVAMEHESARIGKCVVPLPFMDATRRGKKVRCFASLDTRIDRLIKEYHVTEGDEKAIKQLETIIQHKALLKVLGKEKVMCSLFLILTNSVWFNTQFLRLPNLPNYVHR
jgi:tRNA 2-selenouridine synthase